MIFDVLKDPVDARDFKVSAIIDPAVVLPTSFCYDTMYVKDQKGVGACVGFAAATMKEIQEWNENKEKLKLSPFFIYWQRGWKEPGMYCRQALQILTEKGICYDETLLVPYDYNENSDIPQKAFEEAQKYKVSSYLRVYTTDEIKKAIHQYGPVLGSFSLTQEFKSMKSDGIVKPVGSSPYAGNHAMTIVGYDDNKKVFKIQNSWGKDWGDHGFCYMPYDLLAYFVIDLWLVVDDKSPKAGARYVAYKIWQNFKIQLEKNKGAAVMGLLFGSIVLLNVIFTKKKPA